MPCIVKNVFICSCYQVVVISASFSPDKETSAMFIFRVFHHSCQVFALTALSSVCVDQYRLVNVQVRIAVLHNGKPHVLSFSFQNPCMAFYSTTWTTHPLVPGNHFVLELCLIPHNLMMRRGRGRGRGRGRRRRSGGRKGGRGVEGDDEIYYSLSVF